MIKFIKNFFSVVAGLALTGLVWYVALLALTAVMFVWLYFADFIGIGKSSGGGGCDSSPHGIICEGEP